MAALADYEGMSHEQTVANMSSIEAFACIMEGALRASHTRVPEDVRESERLRFLAQRARALVLSR